MNSINMTILKNSVVQRNRNFQALRFFINIKIRKLTSQKFSDLLFFQNLNKYCKYLFSFHDFISFFNFLFLKINRLLFFNSKFKVEER